MKRKTPFSSAAVIGFGLIAAACSSSDLQNANPLTIGQWRQMPAHLDNSVELVALDHTVAFAANAVQPGEVERRRMLDFVANNDVTVTDEIELGAAPGPDGTYDPVTAARLEALENEFMQLGLPASVSNDPAVMARGAADQIAIVVHRAVAVPPDCSVPQPGFAQRPDWKVGCSVKASLGYMVADPRDLAKGRPLGPGDAEALSRSVEVYRNPNSENAVESDSLADTAETTTGE